jgi:hypothetical protein
MDWNEMEHVIIAMLCASAGGIWSGIIFGQESLRKKLKNLMARRIIQITDHEGKAMTGDELIALLQGK